MIGSFHHHVHLRPPLRTEGAYCRFSSLIPLCCTSGICNKPLASRRERKDCRHCSSNSMEIIPTLYACLSPRLPMIGLRTRSNVLRVGTGAERLVGGHCNPPSITRKETSVPYQGTTSVNLNTSGNELPQDWVCILILEDAESITWA